MNEREFDIMMLEAEDWVGQLFEEFRTSWLGMRAEDEEEEIELVEVEDGEEGIEEAPWVQEGEEANSQTPGY